ncbi:MAG: zinc-dependent metalloprotease [Aureliella sp.]
MYTLYTKDKEGQMLIELPKSYSMKKYFIGLTVASGQTFAGLQAGDYYVQWRQYNKRLALISPNMQIRSGGDSESKSSVNRLFTGQVLLDLPIITMSPRGGPVIDGDQLLVGNAATFFGPSGRSRNPGLAKIVKRKAFEKNVELAFEMPSTSGKLQTLYYSISEIPASTGYKPRKADQRVGYFTTSYSDYGKYKRDDVDINFINRWHLTKRDSSLALSPPVEPIKFYLEHTTPVRYRRWVKMGVLYWNKAFERVGISDAIEVVYQDKATNKHMDKDPEDVRYNFIRWLNNNVSTAIGPSRVHPETGQILDADIVLTDGWIRYFNEEFKDYMPLLAMEGMNDETLAWLAQHPNWDPRVRFAEPSKRAQVAAQLRAEVTQQPSKLLPSALSTRMMGDDPFDGLVGRTSQVNGYCLAAQGRRVDTSIMRMILAMGPEFLLGDADEAEKKRKKKKGTEDGEKDTDKDAGKEEGDDDEKDGEDASDKADSKDEEKEAAKKDEPKKPTEPMLDGMPESFIGPLLADLVAHEVGHTLGLRHNFKASSIYSLEEINSKEIKGEKAFAGSVMDYLPVNLKIEEGEIQGDYAMIGLGPYDFWAIEYGYSFDKDPAKKLSRVSEPQLQFATDEDTSGPDPLARRYDFSALPLDYANEQTRLIKRFRKRLMTDYVKDGDSWSKAREGYELTLNLQMKNASMMSNWIGGAHVNRDKKGDPKDRTPIEVVAADKQRAALKYVLEASFRDEAYALSSELLSRLTKDFMDGFGDPTWPVHDRILQLQAATLTQLMNTTTLRRVYDNEFRVPADQDAFTLPELLGSVTDEIWSELEGKADGKYSTRKPMISSLRRNLQAEQLERLIDLTLPGNGSSAANKAISNLCMMEITELKAAIDELLESSGDSLDPYSKAHLAEATQRITKALDADYVYNQSSSGGSLPFLLFGNQTNNGTEQE